MIGLGHRAARALVTAAGLVLLASGARATDQAGTWAASGVVKSRLCIGGRCHGAAAHAFRGRIMLKRDGTYRIPGQTCPTSGAALPDEVGTWTATRSGRLVFAMGNASEVALALGRCLSVDALDLQVTRGWVQLAGRGARGCKRAGGGEHLCGVSTMKGPARTGGRAARYQAVARFTATRDADAGRCGDGRADAGEDCDDGNLDDGDTCSSTCRAICRPEPVTNTWDAIRSRVFARHSCAEAACHGGSSIVGLDLRPDVAYANLVDVASSELPTQKRVAPGAPEDSLLWRKLAKATLGGFDDVPQAGMPTGAAPLSRDELEGVRLWIATGAPATGLVPGTDQLLAGCPPPPPPVDAPAPPAPSEGIQLHAPPWTIPPHGEDEVCYPTYYDVSAQVPAEDRLPCPAQWGGPANTCFSYNRTTLTQDANSHHSIIHVYSGAHDPSDGSFGTFTCHGGPEDGKACDPKRSGVAAPAGADCGAGGACAGTVVSSVACIGYGPSDFVVDLAGVGGAQEPHSELAYPDGVYSVLPLRGVVIWNSHAFNLTDRPTTNQQWFNIYFAGAADRRYPARGLFDVTNIFVQDVPAFTRQEYCSTDTLPRGARIFQLGSHTHKRGALFRIWGPGLAPCSPGPGCDPEPGPALASTTQYTHPVNHRFDPPLELPATNAAGRTFKFCALYDNGFTDPGSVRRASTTPPRGMPCYGSDLLCLDGPKRGTACDGSDRRCDSGPKARDGLCDACTLRGGVTTEDEMFILLGAYYCPEGSDCFSNTP